MAPRRRDVAGATSTAGTAAATSSESLFPESLPGFALTRDDRGAGEASAEFFDDLSPRHLDRTDRGLALHIVSGSHPWLPDIPPFSVRVAERVTDDAGQPLHLFEQAEDGLRVSPYVNGYGVEVDPVALRRKYKFTRLI